MDSNFTNILSFQPLTPKYKINKIKNIWQTKEGNYHPHQAFTDGERRPHRHKFVCECQFAGGQILGQNNYVQKKARRQEGGGGVANISI